MLAVLHSERFVDQAPATVVATLMDEGRYLCSARTMYRLLAEHLEIRERRRQATHPNYKRPELLATAPNQTWSWDVTLLRGPTRGTYYYLFVLLDIFSRYIVGWTLAHAQTGQVATRLIRQTCRKQAIVAGQLTLHADRGSVPTGDDVADVLHELGVGRSLSRPHVSDDNPYSEAQFKTFKYAPDYPEFFPSFQRARAYCSAHVDRYNNHHRHSGIAFFTPSDVHHHRIDAVLEVRTATLAAAHAAHPERFVRGAPIARRPPAAVYINPPKELPTTQITKTDAH